jgi:hypothetical protein
LCALVKIESHAREILHPQIAVTIDDGVAQPLAQIGRPPCIRCEKVEERLHPDFVQRLDEL